MNVSRSVPPTLTVRAAVAMRPDARKARRAAPKDTPASRAARRTDPWASKLSLTAFFASGETKRLIRASG